MKQAALDRVPLALLLLLGPAWAQSPRPPVQVETTLVDEATSPAVATDGNLCAIAFGDGGSFASADEIRVSVSDGRGLVWSTPVRVDAGPLGVLRSTHKGSVRVAKGRVYVAWSESRHGNHEIYLNRSLDAGASWEGEAPVPKGFPLGLGSVRTWRYAVAPDPAGGDDHLYFLISVEDPAGGFDVLFLLASHDGGASFDPALHVPGFAPGSGPDVDSIAMVLTGPQQVHMVWNDDRLAAGPLDHDVWYRRSLDGGATLHPLEAHLNITAPGSVWFGNVQLAAQGPKLLAAWDDYRSGPTSEVRYNRSKDGGSTWLPAGDVLVGGYEPGVDSAHLGDVAIHKNRHLITYHDMRTGTTEASVSVSTSGGESWTEHTLSTGGNAYYPAFAGGGDYVAVGWWRSAGTRAIEASLSRNAGLTWGPPVSAGLPGSNNNDHVMRYAASEDTGPRSIPG